MVERTFAHTCETGAANVASRPGVGEEAVPADGGEEQPGTGGWEVAHRGFRECWWGVLVPVECPESAPNEANAPPRSSMRLPDKKLTPNGIPDHLVPRPSK